MQHIQNLFTTLAESKKNGAELSSEVEKQAEGFLLKFEEFYNNPYLNEKVQEKGKEIFAYFMNGMVDGKGEAIDTADMSLREMINTVRSTLDMNAPEVEQKAKGMFSGVFDLIKNNINNVNDSSKNIDLSGVEQRTGTTKKKVCSSVTEMNNSTSRNFQNIRRNGEMHTARMSNNVVNNVNRMKSNVGGIDLFSTGVNVINGLINGMMSKLSAVSMAATTVASTVKNTINHALDINSPSRVLYKTGVYTGQGQIEGMKSTLPEIQQTANKMGQKSVPDRSDDKKYSPSGSAVSYNRSSTSENVNYAPVFNLTISGTSDDRAMARKVKNWVAEKLAETFESYERKSGTVREV